MRFRGALRGQSTTDDRAEVALRAPGRQRRRGSHSVYLILNIVRDISLTAVIISVFISALRGR